MDSDLIEYEGGDILANAEERTITGLLVPFNELGHTNAGRFMVEAGALSIPADPSVVGLNLDHDRSQPVGRASRLWETARGIMATFRLANTPDGDAALADALSPTGKRRRLSGEFHTAIRAGKAVPGSGRLWGGALVPQGAFPSAMVLAADRGTTTPDAAPAAPATTEGNPTMADQAPVAAEAVVTPVQPVIETPPAAAPVAVAPVAVAAALPVAPVAPIALTQQGAPIGRTQAVDETAQVLAALTSLRTNPFDGDAMQVLAAITDVTMSGTNTLPGTGVVRPNWLGKIYQGLTYVREYINLGMLGTDISAGGKLGFKVHRNTAASPQGPQDGTWPGNKQPINGYRGDSNTIASLLYRFAIGNDIDRSLYDLPGGSEVVEEFLRLIVEDYYFWSDRIARETVLGAAGAPVANATYPGIYATNGTTALAQVIQGILAVRRRKTDGRRDVPTYALVNDIAFSQLAYAAGGDQNLPAFINLALSSLASAQSEVGTVGPVVVFNGDTGVQATSSVIVGAKQAIDFDELPGGPLVINAIDIARGGIDTATHGYLQTFVKRPEAIVHIGTPDAWAATTAVQTGQYMKNGAATLQAQNAGTTGASAPTNPAVGANVTDGTVVWKRLA